MVTQIKSSLLSPNVRGIRQLFDLSIKMADLTEDILESSGAYSKEFLAGLRKSFRESQNGKLRKIALLAELK